VQLHNHISRDISYYNQGGQRREQHFAEFAHEAVVFMVIQCGKPSEILSFQRGGKQRGDRSASAPAISYDVGHGTLRSKPSTTAGACLRTRSIARHSVLLSKFMRISGIM